MPGEEAGPLLYARGGGGPSLRFTMPGQEAETPPHRQKEPKEALMPPIREDPMHHQLEHSVQRGAEGEPAEHDVLAVGGRRERVDAERTQREDLRLEDAQVVVDGPRDLTEHRQVHDHLHTRYVIKSKWLVRVWGKGIHLATSAKVLKAI